MQKWINRCSSSYAVSCHNLHLDFVANSQKSLCQQLSTSELRAHYNQLVLICIHYSYQLHQSQLYIQKNYGYQPTSLKCRHSLKRNTSLKQCIFLHIPNSRLKKMDSTYLACEHIWHSALGYRMRFLHTSGEKKGEEHIQHKTQYLIHVGFTTFTAFVFHTPIPSSKH